jgi:hypothetical protein
MAMLASLLIVALEAEETDGATGDFQQVKKEHGLK